MDRHAVAGPQFHRTGLHDAGAQAGHFQHLIVSDFLHFASVFHDPRVGGIHAVHIRVNLANFGVQRPGQRHRRRVRSAPAQRRDVAIGRLALKTGDNNDIAAGQFLEHAVRIDFANPSFHVHRVGHDSRLRAGQGYRRTTEIGKGHRQ